MGNIERGCKISRLKLDEEHYFQSLLEHAHELNMASPALLEKAQAGCLEILAKQAELYNKGGSSSIRIEDAKEILASIMFTIGIQLKTYRAPDDAIAALENEKIEAIYQLGLRRISRMIKTAKILHARVLDRLFETRNVFYNDTVIDAIKGFFKLYDPALAAHKIHITADYPVYNPMTKTAGIEFILNYLEFIGYENSLCLHFPAEAAHRLLCGYVEGYEGCVMNIYEIVLTQATGCILSSRDPFLLNLTQADIECIGELFAEKNSRGVRDVLSKAFLKIGGLFPFTNGIKQYMAVSFPMIASAIETAIENRTIARVFILPK